MDRREVAKRAVEMVNPGGHWPQLSVTVSEVLTTVCHARELAKGEPPCIGKPSDGLTIWQYRLAETLGKETGFRVRTVRDSPRFYKPETLLDDLRVFLSRVDAYSCVASDCSEGGG